MATTPSDNQGLLFVCRHGEREDYRWKARGERWQAQAERPWDTPLTPEGHLQAQALGKMFVQKWFDELRCPPITRILVSPLLRCVETGAAIAEVLGLEEVIIDQRLAETMCEEWYRSWGTPWADSTWGGEEMSKEVTFEQMHKAAQGPASGCHATAETIEDLRTRFSLSQLARSIRVVPSDKGVQNYEYCWGNFESEEMQQERIRAVAESEAPTSDSTGSVLLVSHGGPTGGLYKSLMKDRPAFCGYCGMFAYKKTEDGWQALVAGNHDHLDLVEGAEKAGPNDRAEQTKAYAR